MTKTEFKKQLSEWKERLENEVIKFYKDGNGDRGKLAFTRWQEQFTTFLRKHTATEADKFVRQIKGGKVTVGGPPYTMFMRNTGSKCLAFIDDLSDAVERDYIEVVDNATGSGTTMEPMSQPHVSSVGKDVDPKKVFVVHGRNATIRNSMFSFLRALGLEPIEWSQAVQRTGKATPYTLEVLQAGFAAARAAVILFTPDDEAHLRIEYRETHEPAYETNLTPQARPNVIFEAGMAMAMSPQRTLVVEFGQLRPISDVVGLNTVRMDNSVRKRQDLAERLTSAGCPANINGRDWHTEGDFELSSVATPHVTPESPKPTELAEDYIRILKLLLCLPDPDAGLTVEIIASELDLTEPRVQYYLEELEEREFVREVPTTDYDGYYITRSGRKFFFER